MALGCLFAWIPPHLLVAAEWVLFQARDDFGIGDL